MSSNFVSRNEHNMFQSSNFIFYRLTYRRLGKKMTPNFLSRYLYGNRNKKGLVNFHVNIRSLKNKVNEVKHIVREDRPDIFGLSEVELNKVSVTENSLKIAEYKTVFPKS